MTGISVSRSAFVALKRSIDPHESNEMLYQISRADFDYFWNTVNWNAEIAPVERCAGMISEDA